MNKFQNLAKKLINNSLWKSTLTYIPRTLSRNKAENTYIQGTNIDISAVVSNINKNLVDNVNLFNTDLVFYVDSTTLSSPSKYDLVKYNNQLYKIVNIISLGNLNNTTTVYEIIIRLS